MLYAKVPGVATAWQPKLADGLDPGAGYVWFVRAVLHEEAGEAVDSRRLVGRAFLRRLTGAVAAGDRAGSRRPAAGRRPGAVIQGLVLIAGSATIATLQDLRVENGCVPDALRATGGARLAGDNLDVERATGLPCPLTADTIFTDGFESGDASVWSSATP